MADRRHRVAAVLVALALATDDEPRPDGCPMCGERVKMRTGECSRCGVYVCGECGRMHMGEARPCPGEGVPVPSGGRRG